MTVTIGASLSVSFRAEEICRGNRVRVQLKTVLLISHHCGPAGLAGTSQTTIPVVRADEKLTAFLELERVTYEIIPVPKRRGPEVSV
jgi:hypothetical protein